jgi:hypothetical protein
MRRALLCVSILILALPSFAKTIDASLFLVPADGPLPKAQYFALDSARMWQALGGASRVEISGFVIDGRSLTLELKRGLSPINAGTEIVIGSTHGDRNMPMPNVLTLRGMIAGEPRSSVTISICGKYMFASIRHEDGTAYDLAPERTTPYPLLEKERDNLHLVMRDNDLLSMGTSNVPNCFADDIAQPNALIPINELLGGRGLAMAVPPDTTRLLQADVAVEADTCFYHAAGSDVPKVVAYIVSMFAMSSVMYEDEANITLHLNWIKVWTDTDPYNVKGDAYALENLIVPYWKAHYANVPRDLAHVMTSVGYGGGGYGWFALCDTNWAYSMSSPTTRGQYPTFAFTYDAYIVAHEIGHNFSLPHSHNCYWDPPLDTCYTKNDTTSRHLSLGDACDTLPILPRASEGTIMSYCANANYALAGYNYAYFKLAMTFSPRVAAVMRANALKAACIQPPDSPMVILQYPHGGEVFNADSIVTIKWTYAHTQYVNLQYSPNNGDTWAPIASQVSAADGGYAWKAPHADSKFMLVRISDASNDLRADTSILNFRIIGNAGVVAASGPTGSAHWLTLDESQNWLTVNPRETPATFEIVDVRGNVVMSGKNSSRIDIRSLPAGPYFVRFVDNNRNALQFVKSK